MNAPKPSLSRRNLLKVGLASIGSVAVLPSLVKAAGEACGLSTAPQPLGPFFPNEDTPFDPIRESPNPRDPLHLANDNDLTFVRGRSGTAKGQVIYLKGVVSNADCQPIPNATLIIWQASESGRYNHKGDSENHDFAHPVTRRIIKRTHDPSFQYWGKAITNEKGEYAFKTIIPGFYPADLNSGWYRPPHIHFLFSATGYPQLVTQTYFRGEQVNDNAWIQTLNSRDILLQDPRLTREERENLIIDFKPINNALSAISSSKGRALTDALEGTFNIQLKR